ncbi:MAG: hypothetical protein RQ866_08080, partial [Bacteroidales bacterium]|nr:hypothetical protein [Bacteroidales bacterium]
MRHFLVILFLLITQGGFTQNEANIWYFGEYAGLDFNSGAPVVLLNSAMVMDEGVSTISDVNGNLFFYTNGIDVWNRNHQKMPNGTGLNGHSSSTNSGFIVPKPGSTTTYYIFTTDAFFGPLGLCYSVVDMTLQAGLGDVTQKNLFLHSPVTEKIAAIEHANGQGLWVVTHQGNSNVFQSWLVTSSGVSTTPVATNIGTVHSNANSGNGIGYMKFSPDGKQLALTIYGLGIIALFDFDAAAGTFSNAQTFPGTWDDVYGIEFSPNGKLLYVSSDTVLLQFDLTAGTLNDIVNTQTQVGGIGQMPMAFIAPVQLGPDRKIYWGVYYSDYLGVINDPNQPGLACNSVAQGVSLGGRHSLSGLPVFVASLFYAKPFHYVNTCFEDTTHFWTNDSLSFDSVTWNFGDPVSGIYNTSSLFAPTHIYTTTGTFTVTMVVFKGLLTDTMIQTIA